jgi:hypothetical protein
MHTDPFRVLLISTKAALQTQTNSTTTTTTTSTTTSESTTTTTATTTTANEIANEIKDEIKNEIKNEIQNEPAIRDTTMTESEPRVVTTTHLASEKATAEVVEDIIPEFPVEPTPSSNMPVTNESREAAVSPIVKTEETETYSVTPEANATTIATASSEIDFPTQTSSAAPIDSTTTAIENPEIIELPEQTAIPPIDSTTTTTDSSTATAMADSGKPQTPSQTTTTTIAKSASTTTVPLKKWNSHVDSVSVASALQILCGIYLIGSTEILTVSSLKRVRFDSRLFIYLFV